MCSLRATLASTTRPWRPLYAYACCCLLPLSLALRPAARVAFSSHPAAATTTTTTPAARSRAASSARGACSGRLSGLPRSTSRARLTTTVATRLASNCITDVGRRRQCRSFGAPFGVGGGGFMGLATPPTEEVGGGRGLATGAWGGRRGRGGGAAGALSMGKGLDRKKAKKSQARTGGGKGVGSSPAAAVAVAAAEPLVALQDITDKDGFLAAFEQYRKAKAPRKVFQAFESAKKKGTEGLADLAAEAVKAELKLSRGDLSRNIIDSLGTEQWDAWLATNLEGAQAVVRCACAASDPVLAEELIEKAGFSCGAAGGLMGERADAAASVYPNLITAYSRNSKRGDAMRLLEAMARARVPVKTAATNRLLQGFHKRRDLEAVFKVLDASAAAGVDGDDETYEWLANAAVRGVDFVTGAVSIATMPKEPALPEAAFIGRSNVGKSSLINMVCNRKALAYTSKRPGKTQQFNYFLVNNNTENAFYLVDMPGMGYAKVPERQRNEWSNLFRSYITRRSSLRVLFHLIDGRHGPVGQDHVIMKLMAELPETARYVVVLTKADKSDNSVSKQVLGGVVSALREAGVSRTPVVLTSASSKLGRDGMWRYLRLAALDKVMREKDMANSNN